MAKDEIVVGIVRMALEVCAGNGTCALTHMQLLEIFV
jgi:hypothetical protein